MRSRGHHDALWEACERSRWQMREIMKSPSPPLPLITQALQHGDQTAIVEAEGGFSYAELLDASARIAGALLSGCGDLEEKRIPFLITPGFAWVAVQ